MKRKALTFNQAQDIRALYATGNYTQKAISLEYQVLSKTISQICNNEILLGNPRKKPVPTAEAEVTYKGLACHENVLTDSGWKRADQVQLTDNLVAIDGTYTAIVSIHQDEDQPLFRVTMDDGVTVDTAADSRWMTLEQKTGWQDGWLLKTTGRLGEIRADHHIATCAAVPGKEYFGKDPYAIGLLLGDGSTVPNISSATLYSQDEFILNYMKNNYGWRRYKYEGQVERVVATNRRTSEEWKLATGKGKAHFKFVPPALLAAGPEVRLAVLQGLMDTDGCADKEGRLSFASVSVRLSADVRYLARSLGGKSTSTFTDRETALGGGPYYVTRVMTCQKFVPFRLPRKVERCHNMKGINRGLRTVVSIDPGPSVSFVIAHELHQFVVNDFVVVHDATGTPSCRKLSGKRTRNEVASESV